MLMNAYIKCYKEIGLKKMPTEEELAEIIECICHAEELTPRQKLIVKAIAD
jgi:hypothetical protein